MPADSFSPTLNLRKPEVGAATDTWGGVAGLNGDLDLIDAIFLATGLGTSVGLHVGTGKTLNVEGSAQFADSTDTTKRVVLLSSGITTATTRSLSFPDENGTLATRGYVDSEVASSISLASEAVGTGAAAFLNVTFPPAAKLVRLQWFLEATPSVNVTFGMRGSIGGVVQTGAHYHQGRIVASQTTMFADQNFSLTSWIVGAPAIQSWGEVAFALPLEGFGHGTYTIRDSAAVRALYTSSFETDTTFASFDGFYFTCSSGSLSTNSFVRCFALV
jgi:hypothetical protein